MNTCMWFMSTKLNWPLFDKNTAKELSCGYQERSLINPRLGNSLAVNNTKSDWYVYSSGNNVASVWFFSKVSAIAIPLLAKIILENKMELHLSYLTIDFG